MSIPIRASLLAPYSQDVTLAAGSASVPTFSFYLDDVPLGGLPGGTAFSFQVYDETADAVIITKTPTIMDSLLGVLTVTLATTDTESLTPGSDLYSYSLYMNNVTANQVACVTGWLCITGTAQFPGG